MYTYIYTHHILVCVCVFMEYHGMYSWNMYGMERQFVR